MSDNQGEVLKPPLHDLQSGKERKEQEPKLVLPRSLDEDIKRRLSIASIMHFVDSAQITDELKGRYWKFLPQRYQSGRTTVEGEYLLYGKELPTGLSITGFHFLKYNFFHYADIEDSEDSIFGDICEVEDTVSPHAHSFLFNPDKNKNRGKKVLGHLHNHPHGLPVQRSQKTVASVGFSGPDEEWNERYLERYGGDGRTMAFLIYYSRPSLDFYKGVKVSKNSESQHLEIVIE